MKSASSKNRQVISFFEIPATDFDRAVDFYKKIFGLPIDRCDCGEEKMGFFPDSGSGLRGAISRAKGFHPSSDGVLIHFVTHKIDTLLPMVEPAGGRVVMPKTMIEAEGNGCFALILDSEGNRIGIHQPE